MKEILLCKYGEIILKGANRRYFEDVLCRELRYRSTFHGKFHITRSQSTIFIEPENEDADIDGMFGVAMRTFGIIAVSRAAECPKTMEAISMTAREYIPQFMSGVSTFKVESRRSDKSFPLNSLMISAEIGGVILECCPHLTVDVKKPDTEVRVEIRENAAYIHAGQFKGAGGMPVGTNGKGLLLLSGGIDSPVAGFMMAKRGVKIEAVHFESSPYTSALALEKVIRLARLLAPYTGSIMLHVVSLTHIQEQLVRCCEEDYFTLLLRRYMMTIAERIANACECGALITGESVGQVASQTMQAISVTDRAVSMPVFRPCIGMDKEEIVQLARKIDTYDTSILPYEDCCTVFTPRHPKTKPVLEKVLAEEGKLNFEQLVNEALEKKYTVYIKAEF